MPKVVEPQIPNYPPQGIQAQLDLLYLWNPDAANELIKQLEEAIKEVQSNLDYNKLVNKPTLDTTSTNALVAGTEEVAGIVKLHKVSKTGSYEDLNDKPDLDLYATKTELSAGLESKADKAALPQNQTGTAGQVYTKTETGAEWQDASGGSSLPDQTGNAGKFLTTDGTNASWGGGYCAASKSFADYTTVVLDAKNYVSNFDNASVVISPISSDTPQDLSTTIFARMGGTTSVGIGFGAYAGGVDSISVGGLSSASAPDALAIGYSATATAANAIQLGTGVNSASSTFQVFDKQLMDANGHIPSERLAPDGTTGQVLSKTDTGMEWKDATGGGDYLPLSGGALTGPIVAPKHTDYSFDYATVLQLRADTNSATGTPFDIQISPIGTFIRFNGGIITTTGISPDQSGTLTLGSSHLSWKNIFVKKINNGADIDVPTTGGTMVVATPPTAAGLVLVSTETGSEWSDVIGNINTLLDSINGEVA